MKRSTGWLAVSLTALLMACGAQQRPDGGQGLLPVESQVPNLSHADHLGKKVSLREPVATLVYFYPRAGTPGCTKEACAFRDVWARFEQAGLRVIGVSSDDDENLREFASEHALPFSLVADDNRVWAKSFGVGSFIGMDARRSFLISPQGRVVKVYADVDPGVHASEVLSDAKQLGILASAEP